MKNSIQGDNFQVFPFIYSLIYFKTRINKREQKQISYRNL